MRCRHLPHNNAPPVTLFRLQFHCGYVTLFKVEAPGDKLDQSIRSLLFSLIICSGLDQSFVQLDFLPVETVDETFTEEDDISDLLRKRAGERNN